MGKRLACSSRGNLRGSVVAGRLVGVMDFLPQANQQRGTISLSFCLSGLFRTPRCQRMLWNSSLVAH